MQAKPLSSLNSILLNLTQRRHGNKHGYAPSRNQLLPTDTKQMFANRCKAFDHNNICLPSAIASCTYS